MNDIYGYHVPMRMLYQQMLRHGDPPLWTPALFAGFNLHGEGQLGAYHPMHQLLYRAEVGPSPCLWRALLAA